MLRTRPQPKQRHRVPVPEELRRSMIEVRDILANHDRDPDDVMIGFDDAIQTEHLIGGMTGADPRPLEFTFHPPGDAGTWQFALHPLEVDDIAEGVMVDLLLYCCTNPACGAKFGNDKEICCRCDVIDDDVAPPPRPPDRKADDLARIAEADALITNSTCPHCGKPCPSYRKTCKHCRRAAVP